MRQRSSFFTGVAVLSGALCILASAPAQQRVAGSNFAPATVAAHKAALKKFVDATNELSPEVRKHLSRSLQNYLRYADASVNGPAASGKLIGEKVAAGKKKHSVWPWDLIPVSNDAIESANRGYTQNTTSSAWCGSSVVVGYEDSGAFLRSDPTEAFGVPVSYNGVSFSTNAGKSFTDLGFLTPGSFFANALIGDPSVTCSSATHFQYASILNTTTPDGSNPLVGPGISFSTDGGKIWSEPLLASALDGNTQLADSPWLAVDPADPQRMYLSYTEIDMLACNSINVVSSANGGRAWSAPQIIDQECVPTAPAANQNMVTGSRIIVAADGRVHVVYEFLPGSIPGVALLNSIRFATSTNHGANFGKPVRIAQLVPSGTSVELNGHLQVTEYPQIAVDRSEGRSRGYVYVIYPDGRNHVVPDTSSASGTYAYPDIFVAKSTNAGRSFTVSGAISPTSKDFGGIGRDQFLPAIAVDKDGEISACYYSRQNDRADLRVDRFCSASSNQGRTWKQKQVSNLDWLPSMNADPLNPGAAYGISEYDSLTSDFLMREDGFFGAFIIELSGNQNVVATKF